MATARQLPYLEKAIAQLPTIIGVLRSRRRRTLAWVTRPMLSAFQKAIDLTKGTFACRSLLGALLCQKAEFTQAEALLQTAVDLEPGSPIGK